MATETIPYSQCCKVEAHFMSDGSAGGGAYYCTLCQKYCKTYEQRIINVIRPKMPKNFKPY